MPQAATGQPSAEDSPGDGGVRGAAGVGTPRVSVIVPVRNAMRFLPETVPSILRAARHAGGVECIYVDNASTDGSPEFLRSLGAVELRVVEAGEGTIAAIRNLGAREAGGECLSFIDADCTIASDYFLHARDVLRTTGAAATGCECRAPADAHWIESAWERMHYQGRDRDVHYLNSANFFVAREAFERIGGFREDLVTGEDAEIGQRLVDNGFRIHESTKVDAVHLGNPKSLRGFYRRTVWHGLGTFGTTSATRVDKPTAITILHLAATALGVLVLVGWRGPLAARLLAALLLQLVAPALTVAYRAWQTRRRIPLLRSVALYWLYYWARIQALVLVASGRGRGFRK